MRVLLVVILALVLIGGGVWMEYQRFLGLPLNLQEEPLILDIPRGTSLRALSDDLASRGVIDHPHFFNALASIVDTFYDVVPEDKIKAVLGERHMLAPRLDHAPSGTASLHRSIALNFHTKPVLAVRCKGI